MDIISSHWARILLRLKLERWQQIKPGTGTSMNHLHEHRDKPRDRSVEKQQLRLHQLKLATLAWALFSLLIAIAWLLDIVDMSNGEMSVLLGAAAASQIFFHLAVRSKLARRLRDPALTLPHILVAILLGLWVVSRADESQALMFVLFIAASLFGAFQLRRREFMLVAAVAIVGYALIVIQDIASGQITGSAHVVIVKLIGSVIIMAWLAWFGSYIARLRRTLSRRNRELEEATERMRHLAEHDELTGLPNRRRLFTRLEQMARQASGQGPGFSIAVLDLDRFKRINDRHGHQAGDDVLSEFGDRVGTLLRGADWLARVDDTLGNIGRFGGEEFLAILPAADLEGAGRAAERLRREVSDHPFSTESGQIHCTVSIGVAQYQPGEPVRQTIARADEALYMAKRAGRNRVEIRPSHQA